MSSGATAYSATDARPEMSDRDFDALVRIAQEAAGLSIASSKRALVQSRISRRMRHLKLARFEDYVALVAAKENKEERRELISALTTNVTSFFRERHHFDTLREEVLPPLLGRSSPKARIWSAGCSRGDEPYSIAIEVKRSFPDIASDKVRILATDIDAAILTTAREGTYPAAQLKEFSPDERKRYFEGHPDRPDHYRIAPGIRDMVLFRELNLHGDWPMRGPLDAIFCRNVVIYFDEDRQRALWRRFHNLLAPGGWLFVGHSERVVSSPEAPFVTAGITTYRKPG